MRQARRPGDRSIATEVEVYLDATVESGTSYRYAIVAQDTGYNLSEPSAAMEITAEERMVEVTFT